EEFVLNDLSRWYVKLVRSRTWKEGEDKGKLAAYRVLHEGLGVVTRMIAPVTPYLAESIYQTLDGRKLSVHMEDFPPVQEQWLNNELEKEMAIAQEIVEVISKARQKKQMKLRWPVRKIAVKPATEDAAKALTTFREVVMSQANAKELVLLKPDQEFDGIQLAIQPNAAAIGRVYKQWWSKIATMLENRPADEVKKALDKGEFKIGIEGQIVRIDPSMVSFKKTMPDDISVVQTPHGEIYVDMRITPEIQAEGYARELIRRIQQMRKETDLAVEDYIRTAVRVRKDFAKLLEPWKSYIAAETRSRSLVIGEDPVAEEYVVEWNIEGETITIGITPLRMAEALSEFTKVPHVTERKAIALYDAGYKTSAALAQATKDDLSRVEGLDANDVKRIREHFEAGGATEPGLCPTCGAEVLEKARTCSRCGEPLGGTGAAVATPAPPPTSPEPAAPVAMECPECGQASAPGTAVCRSCGHRFVEAPERPPAAPPPPAVKVSLTSAPEKGASVNCPFCDAPVPPDAVNCPSCGTSLRLAAKGAAPATTLRVEIQEPPPAKPLPELHPSSTYLVKEESPMASYQLFIRTVAAGVKGFCVTRTFPGKVREQYGLPGVPVLWLSNVGKEDTVRPKDLEKLSLSLEQFISQEKGIVVIDGVEYLITNNNFITVLRLVQALRDQVAMHGAILLFSVNPSALDEHQLHLLEREVDQVVDLRT
ncbi:MAG: DUF835 domain-containing protein, partial [Methanobacteriota archaeon]